MDSLSLSLSLIPLVFNLPSPALGGRVGCEGCEDCEGYEGCEGCVGCEGTEGWDQWIRLVFWATELELC